MLSIVAVVAAWFVFYRTKDDIRTKNYIGNSVEECSRIQVLCVDGFERFDDNDGCGCRPISIPDNWKAYSNNTIGFSIKYDPSLILQESTKTDVRFYKWGPTQRGQTEVYDGIIFSVRKISVTDGGQTHINTQIEQFKNVGTITEPLHDSSLNGVPVKRFGASGLGDFKIIFVPIDNQTIIEISYMIPDPTGVGFQKIVDQMLSTFKIN